MKINPQRIEINEYDTFLYEMVQNLDKYAFHEGSEGRAYFIDNKFVVKEIRYVPPRRVSEQFDSVFDSYCREIQSFAEAGYSVPKIYSWLKLPNAQKNRFLPYKALPYIYYILEEYVPGRWIYYFYEERDELFKLCESFCSRDEFDGALGNYNQYALRRQILKAYIKDYVMVNEWLESMSDNEFEKFITSAYKMTMSGRFSSIDVYRKNILLDVEKLTLIDSRSKANIGFDYYGIENYFITPLFEIISYNSYLDDNDFLSSSDKLLYDKEIGKLLAKNRKLCIALTQKMLDIINNKLGMRPIKRAGEVLKIKQIVKETFKEDAEKIMPLIHTDFEK